MKCCKTISHQKVFPDQRDQNSFFRVMEQPPPGLTTYAFLKLFKKNKNENKMKFLAKLLLLLWRKKNEIQFLSGAGGHLSVRTVQKRTYFLVSRHMAFCQAEFWAGLKSVTLVLTRSHSCSLVRKNLPDVFRGQIFLP